MNLRRTKSDILPVMIRARYIIFFVLAVCCSFRHNAAIPLASHSTTNQMQDIFKEKKTDSQRNWHDTTLQSYANKETGSHVAPDRDSATRPHDLNYRGPQKKKIMNNNQKHNVIQNMNSFDGQRYKKDRKKASAPATIPNLEDVLKKEQLVSCTIDKKKNQRYSISFTGNVTKRNLSVDMELDEVVGNNSRTKTVSSVHEEEDITLCWIETMTIKEDRTVQPPKRLVIREYTISFENSATIPERYLECKRLEGELAIKDPEIGKTALFEVIDEDTKVSKVVNFTSVNHVGDVIVWQYKRVKCGVGPVVSKNIMEWNDDTNNPKKRVEIKISPKVHKLTTKGEEEPCTESSEEKEMKTTMEPEQKEVEDITTESERKDIKKGTESTESEIEENSTVESSTESEGKEIEKSTQEPEIKEIVESSTEPKRTESEEITTESEGKEIKEITTEPEVKETKESIKSSTESKIIEVEKSTTEFGEKEIEGSTESTAESKTKEVEESSTESEEKEIEDIGTESEGKEVEEMTTESEGREVEKMTTESERREIIETSTEPKEKGIEEIGTESEGREVEKMTTESERRKIVETSTEPEEKKIEEIGTESEGREVEKMTTESERREIIETSTEPKEKKIKEIGTESEGKKVEEMTTESERREIIETSTESKEKEIEEIGTESEGKEVEEMTTESKRREIIETSTEPEQKEIEESSTEPERGEVEEITTESAGNEIVGTSTEVEQSTTESEIEEIEKSSTEPEKQETEESSTKSSTEYKTKEIEESSTEPEQKEIEGSATEPERKDIEESTTEAGAKGIEESSEATVDTSYVTAITKFCQNTETGEPCEMTTNSNEISTRYLETSSAEFAKLPDSETAVSGTEGEVVFITKPASEEEIESTESSVATEEPFTTTAKSVLLSSKENVFDCENSLDPACAMREVTTSAWELPTESSTMTETMQTEASPMTPIDIMTTSSSQEAITELVTEEELSNQEEPLVIVKPIESMEENTSKGTSELVTVGTSLFTPTTMYEYGSVPMTTSEPIRQLSAETTVMVDENPDHEHDIITATTLGADITTSPSVINGEGKKKDLTDNEISSPISVELREDYHTLLPLTESRNNQSDREHVSLLDKYTVPSSEIKETTTEGVITTETPLFIKFIKEPGGSNNILNNLLSFSTENILTELTSMRSKSIESSVGSTTEPLSSETVASTFLTTEELFTNEVGNEDLTGEMKEITTIIPKTIAKEFIPVTSTAKGTSKIPEIETDDLTMTSEYDYACENSEDCVYDSRSNLCEESGDCDSQRESNSCETGLCSEEQSIEDIVIANVTSAPTIGNRTSTIESSHVAMASEVKQHFASTTATTLSFKENDNSSMTIDIIPTMETRRSTPLSMTTIKPRHKLVLKIKVVLEHVEKKQRENLINFEKELLLNENPEDHDHSNLLKQLKALNDSISMEAISALLNCTNLNNMTRDVNFIDKKLNRNNNSESDKFQLRYADPISKQSSSLAKDKYKNSRNPKLPQFDKVSRKRNRRDFASNKKGTSANTIKSNSFDSSSSDVINAKTTKNSVKSVNKLGRNTINTIYKGGSKSTPVKIMNNEKKKMEIVREALPEVTKDVSVGLQDVMSQVKQYDSMANLKNLGRMDLLDIIVDPKNNRFHSRRKRAATEELGHWSNERIKKTPMGGNLRSFTELVLYNVLS